MGYNYDKLRGKIREKFKTESAFALAIAMSTRTLSLKLNGERDWRQAEIDRACELLDVKREDIPYYFFAQ